MRPKSLLLLALALGCGLVASIGISQVMDRNANRPQAALETTPIYVALHNINLNDPIDASMVSLQDWPKDKVPPGTISELEDIEGRRTRTMIFEGEPLLEGKLLAPGAMADPIGGIPTGYRLKTISVDAKGSVAGLLSPGDRVDIQLFVNRDPRNGVEFAMTKVILQNIRIYAVDQTVQRAQDGSESRAIARTISLLLKPEQASKVTLAEHLGVISLIPRNPDDEESESWAEYTAEDLLSDGGKGSRRKERGQEESKPSSEKGLLSAIREAVPPPVPPFRMEIVEAAEVREELFDAETGRPLRDLGTPSTSTSPHVGSSQGSDAMDSEVEDMLDLDEDDVSLDDFPIDFGE